MLVKAFNRLPMTEGFGGKTNLTKKTKTKKKQVLNIGIHYEAFSGMSFLRKEKRQIFKFLRPSKWRHCYIQIEKIKTYIVANFSISRLETENRELFDILYHIPSDITKIFI